MNRYTLTFTLQAHKAAPAVIDTVTVDAVDLEEAEYAGFAILNQRHPDRFTMGRLIRYADRTFQKSVIAGFAKALRGSANPAEFAKRIAALTDVSGPGFDMHVYCANISNPEDASASAAFIDTKRGAA